MLLLPYCFRKHKSSTSQSRGKGDKSKSNNWEQAGGKTGEFEDAAKSLLLALGMATQDIRILIFHALGVNISSPSAVTSPVPTHH